MKLSHTLIALLTLSACGSAQAAATYDITLSASDKKVHLAFASKEIFPSMCNLEVSKISLEKPGMIFSHPNGLVAIEAAVAPMSICLDAFGPHSGELNLGLGQALPLLVDGQYDFVINNNVQGNLTINGSKSQFTALTDPIEVPLNNYLLRR